MSSCKDVEELLHGYLDKELLQFDEQRVRNHLDECASCQHTLDEYRKMKEDVAAMEYEMPAENEWDQHKPVMAVRVSRGIGWLLFCAAVAILTIFGIYEFTVDPAVKALEKVGVLALLLGVVFLFVSVAYERMLTAKSDKYTEVEK